ncbi:MAG: hypothetical protein K6F69_02970 [Treponema sp.]|nr:hypothetical protein [Treponema sp.]
MGNNGHKPEAKYEPGTLDRTRANIGAIDEEEAKRMTKILGGEIFIEKSPPLDLSGMPKNRTYAHASDRKKNGTAPAADDSNVRNALSVGNTGVNVSMTGNHVADSNNLPLLSDKTEQLMDKLMMSGNYKIKSNFGVFNFIRVFQKNGRNKVSPTFCEYTLKNYIAHMKAFIEDVKMLIQMSSTSFKLRIPDDPNLEFRLIKTVGNWTMRDINALYDGLSKKSNEVTVPMLVPIVRAMFRPLITLYYLGDARISRLFHNIYEELILAPGAQKRKLEKLVKETSAEWLYISDRVIFGMYPLLMRMSSTVFEDPYDFFRNQIGNILKFLSLTKYDLLLPSKKNKNENGASSNNSSEESSKDNEAVKIANAKLAKAKEELGKKDDAVISGLRMLEQLFPSAGFNNIENMPDMYPYFQPLYDFEDGFNIIEPSNPMMVTVVLIRILEDFFQGCRNINFNFEADEELQDPHDTINDVFNDWAQYREDLFEKRYCGKLRDFTSQMFAQSDFPSSQYGKKLITEMQWQTQYNFLPHYKFQQLLLERPSNESSYRPMCLRTTFLRKSFSLLVKRINKSAKTKDIVLGLINPWERYKFDIPNEISKRLDVLLGAKRKVDTAATNANLIKYAYCIISVLDWWVNNTESPAYKMPTDKLYRTSEDGSIGHSIPVRNDQNKLFIDSVKEAVARRQAQQQS